MRTDAALLLSTRTEKKSDCRQLVYSFWPSQHITPGRGALLPSGLEAGAQRGQVPAMLLKNSLDTAIDTRSFHYRGANIPFSPSPKPVTVWMMDGGWAEGNLDCSTTSFLTTLGRMFIIVGTPTFL